MDALHLEANVNPMHDAGRENDVAALRDLLATHDVDEEDQYTLTALHWACDTGSNDVAAVLLAAGADANRVERRRFKRRPVHFAALNGSTCLLELLRNVGNADMHAIDGMGRTPLHCASHGGSVDAVVWLLDVAGSDASAVTFGGHTALDLAVLNHQAAVVKFLEARHIHDHIHVKLLPASDKTRSRATLHG